MGLFGGSKCPTCGHPTGDDINTTEATAYTCLKCGCRCCYVCRERAGKDGHAGEDRNLTAPQACPKCGEWSTSNFEMD